MNPNTLIAWYLEASLFDCFMGLYGEFGDTDIAKEWAYDWYSSMSDRDFVSTFFSTFFERKF